MHDVTLSVWAGDTDRARLINDQVRQVANDHEMTLWKVFCDLYEQVIGCMQDDPVAVARLPRAIDDYVATGGGLWVSLHRSEHAKALLRAGDLTGAQTAVELTLKQVADGGEQWADAELTRIRGEVLLARKDHAGGEIALREAIAIARRQKARILELRAATSLARATDDTQPCDELITALSGFGPDQASPELTAAREILAQGRA